MSVMGLNAFGLCSSSVLDLTLEDHGLAGVDSTGMKGGRCPFL